MSKETCWLYSKPISEASQYDLLTNTELWVVFSRWPLIGFKTGSSHNELLDPVLFFRSVVISVRSSKHEQFVPTCTNNPVNNTVQAGQLNRAFLRVLVSIGDLRSHDILVKFLKQ